MKKSIYPIGLLLTLFLSNCNKEDNLPRVINDNGINIDSVVNKVNEQIRHRIDSIYKQTIINFNYSLITVKEFNYNVINNNIFYYNIELVNYALLDKEINLMVKLVNNNEIYISNRINLIIGKSKEVVKDKEYKPTTLIYSDSIVINNNLIDGNVKIYYSINNGVDWLLIK